MAKAKLKKSKKLHSGKKLSRVAPLTTTTQTNQMPVGEKFKSN
jgi:hypothetical protein